MFRPRRSRFGKRRFVRSSVLWTESGTQTIQDDGATHPNIVANPIFPVARSSFLCNTRARKSFRLTRCQMWLTFSIFQANGIATGNNNLAGSLFAYLIRGKAGSDNAPDVNYIPFGQPEVPSAMTSWLVDSEAWANDPFIWRCRMYPNNMNMMQVYSPGEPGWTGTSYIDAGAGGTTLGFHRGFGQLETTNVFKPNVQFRMRTTMQSDSVILMGIGINDQPVYGAADVVYQIGYTAVFWGR